MRIAVALVALFVSGCGASVEPATNNEPLVCGPVVGRYAWTWERRSGTCSVLDRVTEGPGFGCNAQPLYAEQRGDRCDLAGDILCPGEVITVACSTTDHETITCDATVSRSDCSGDFTLTMRRVD